MRSARPPIDFSERSFDDAVTDQLVGHTVADVECALILKTLSYFAGNRTRASISLGISVRCLRDKIRQFRDQGMIVFEPHCSKLSSHAGEHRRPCRPKPTLNRR
jgi:hypothetical protein